MFIVLIQRWSGSSGCIYLQTRELNNTSAADMGYDIVPESRAVRLIILRSRGLVRDERPEIPPDDDVPAWVPPRVEVLLDLLRGRKTCQHAGPGWSRYFSSCQFVIVIHAIQAHGISQHHMAVLTRKTGRARAAPYHPLDCRPETLHLLRVRPCYDCQSERQHRNVSGSFLAEVAAKTGPVSLKIIAL